MYNFKGNDFKESFPANKAKSMSYLQQKKQKAKRFDK